MEKSADDPDGPPRETQPLPDRPPRFLPSLIAACAFFCAPAHSLAQTAELPSRIREAGALVYGADQEGGAPFLFPPEDPNAPMQGFEVDLMDALAAELGVKARFQQGQWYDLLSVLNRGDIDVVVNGYEKTRERDERFLSSRPYYAYQVQLIARRDGPLRSWADAQFPKPGGGRWRIGVLTGSGADRYAQITGASDLVQVVQFDGTTNALIATVNGQIDGTLQDLAPAKYYLGRKEYDYGALALAGPPEACGYYAIYMRQEDAALRDAVDAAIGRLLESGKLREIYERWGIWNDAQGVLAGWSRQESAPASSSGFSFDLGKLAEFGPTLLASAGMTVFLACTAMPLAILAGIAIALGRVYGPAPLRWALRCYVEVVRGTPLMLQLYVLFYLLPELNIYLPAIAAGILGLAINYSAYEAEIYRAGLQAIPRGQMEAALALGMGRAMAVRRVILPQAVRIVIPPVTNDFIAMFKDTSVCSVITLVELTKQYSILYNSHGGVVEFGLAAAVLYLAMSLPLSWLANGFERRLAAGGAKGGVVG